MATSSSLLCSFFTQEERILPPVVFVWGWRGALGARDAVATKNPTHGGIRTPTIPSLWWRDAQKAWGSGGCRDLGAVRQRPQVLGSLPGSPSHFLVTLWKPLCPSLPWFPDLGKRRAPSLHPRVQLTPLIVPSCCRDLVSHDPLGWSEGQEFSSQGRNVWVLYRTGRCQRWGCSCP